MTQNCHLKRKSTLPTSQKASHKQTKDPSKDEGAGSKLDKSAAQVLGYPKLVQVLRNYIPIVRMR